MENEAAKKYLSALLDHVFDLLYVRFFGPNHAEHIFLQICKVLREREGLRGWFVDEVRTAVMSEKTVSAGVRVRPSWHVDDDLIFFLAHVLQWDEFREIAISRARMLEDTKRPALGSRDFSELLLNSLEPDWEDREFYESL